ncbi:hypothetical protein BASA60_007803 [Batrachochytrium salamandrivorans]|nr:hypothetical protein BASA60_007803 [Batrachochytrium salamandrivorans]KAH9247735.1 hypothetical protein BASA81_014663 [Batrachochytrium salamandrivorans]KAH9275538.1 hypothetical protein BASA83_001820 [Batrachochytrium salamandrivorans]
MALVLAMASTVAAMPPIYPSSTSTTASTHTGTEHAGKPTSKRRMSVEQASESDFSWKEKLEQVKKAYSSIGQNGPKASDNLMTEVLRLKDQVRENKKKVAELKKALKEANLNQAQCSEPCPNSESLDPDVIATDLAEAEHTLAISEAEAEDTKGTFLLVWGSESYRATHSTSSRTSPPPST